jgi:hypothetical protein
VLGRKLPISLQIDIALHGVGNRKDVADLWPNPGHARFEGADMVARAAVTGDLIVDITYCAQEELLRQEL